MSELDHYALGVDAAQQPTRVAIVRGGTARMWSAPDTTSASTVTADAGLADDLVGTIDEVRAVEGGTLSALVLAIGRHDQSFAAELAVGVAERLGLDLGAISTIDSAEAGALGASIVQALRWAAPGTTGPSPGDSDAAALGAAARAAQVGAAASPPSGASGTSGPSPSLLAAGGLGVAAGGAVGAGLLNVGGAGAAAAASTGSAAALGFAGVPLAAPTAAAAEGVPFLAGAAQGFPGVSANGAAAGPGGVGVGSGAGVGPIGTALRQAVVFVREHVLALTVATVAAAGVLIGIVAAADRDGEPSTAPPPPVTTERRTTTSAPRVAASVTTDVPTSGVAETDVVTDTVESSVPETIDASATTTIPVESTTSLLVPNLVGNTCAVGSWTADNETLDDPLESLAGGAADASGATTTVITADGTVTTTFDNWTLTAVIVDLPTTSITNGVETGTVHFADDGTYTAGRGTSTSSAAVTVAGGVTVAQPTVRNVFEGTSSYTCDATRLVIGLPDTAFSVGFDRSG